MTRLNAYLTRRDLIRRGIVVAGALSSISLLAACEVDDDDDDVVTDPDDVDEPVDEPEEDDEEPNDEPEEDDEEPVDEPEAGTLSLNLPEMTSDPTTMNPLFTRSILEQGICTLHFGSLIKMDETTAPAPDLAESWEVSEDALHFTFEIHEDATWTDGEPFTAQDVIFTFERAVTPETESTRTQVPLFVAGAQEMWEGETDTLAGLNAPDPKTLEIELEEPNSALVFQFASGAGQGILPKHLYEDIAPAELQGHELSRNPTVGAGPFQLTEWATEQYQIYEPNQDYVKGAPSLESIILTILHRDVAVAQLETGEVDLAPVSIDDIERLEGNPDLEVVSVPSLSITSLMVNAAQPYLSQPIRQAFMHAINRQGIVDSVYDGLAEVVHTSVIGPEWMGDIINDADLNTYPYDPERAEAILEEEGWDPDQSVELMYPIDQQAEEPALTIIQENLRAVGVNLEIRSYEFAELRARRETDEFDMALLMGGVYRAEPAIATSYYLPAPDGSDNILRYNNPELNELYDQGLREPDQEARREIYLQAAKIINETLPNIYLWSPYFSFAMSNRFGGLKAPNHQNNFLWNPEEWTVVE